MMSGRFLDKVVARTQERVAKAKGNGYITKLRDRAASIQRKPRAFFKALSRDDRVNIIAEIKRASPSRGVIRANANVAAIARRYQTGGAVAISVLTEPEFFDGSVTDLLTATKAVDVPVLRKDFIIDEYQIIEAAAAGASAILLIVAALEKAELVELLHMAGDIGLDCLVEVHDASELEIAAAIGATIIGVNNRDLHTLEVSLDTSRTLAKLKPDDCVFVTESGVTTKSEIEEFRNLGFDAFLIGEVLMRSDGLAVSVSELI